MKKIGIFLTALLLSTGAMAEKTDQDGRVWVSASDLKTQPTENTIEISKERVMKFITKGNDITLCHFPEIWNAKSQDERLQILEKWQADKETDLFMYHSLHYPLLIDSFGEVQATNIFEGNQSLEPIIVTLSEQEKNHTTVKTDADCKAIFVEVKRLFTTYPSQPYASEK